jgi:ferrochelatase
MPTHQGQHDYIHGSPECTGVLLTNLGTPDAPTPDALRRYLREFLGDPRVVELPRPIWWLILNGVVLRTRPKRSAALYQRVWTEAGPPLLRLSRRQAQALQTALEARFAGPVKVELAMRYGNPSIESGLAALHEAGARRVLVFPLYPQYSATTTGSTFDAVARTLQRWRWIPELRFINQYHDDDGYIAALTTQLRRQWEAFGEPEHLLFSFHGIPKQYFLAGDPYHCHCHKTARLVTEQLGLPAERWALSFQSRVGPKEWLKPYTDHVLRDWGKKGYRNVHVICPGFATDCLETLDEIDRENRAEFEDAGGEGFRYIPALNDSPEHIQALADLVARHTQGWPETHPDWNATAVLEAQELSKRLALAKGASL